MKLINELKNIFNTNRKLFIVVLTLFIGIGLSLAFFIPHISNGATGNVSVITGTVDILNFTMEPENLIKIEVDQDNFGQGTNSLKDSVTAKAILKANSKTKTVTEHYYVYTVLNNKEFIYTTKEETPELLLKVTKNGVELKEIPGLVYKTVDNAIGGAQSGFDITTKDGILTIADNVAITDDYSDINPTIDTWNLEFIFVNLQTNQFENTGKKMNAEVVIKKGPLVNTIDEVCKNGDNLANCVQKLSEESTPSITGLYHHTEKLAYSANDGSYRYAGGDPNNFVCFGSNETPCPNANKYRIIGKFGDQVKLIKADYLTSEDFMPAAQSLPFSEASSGNMPPFFKEMIDNYQIKHGSYNKFDVYTGDYTGDVFTKLNDSNNYLKNLDPSWIALLNNSSWKSTSMTEETVAPTTNATKMYELELGKPTEQKVLNGKLGMMYISDYMYGALPKHWTLPFLDMQAMQSWDNKSFSTYTGKDYSKAIRDNWLDLGFEFSVSNVQGKSLGVGVTPMGIMTLMRDGIGLIRPSLYLKSSTTYSGGIGTFDDPIKINNNLTGISNVEVIQKDNSLALMVDTFVGNKPITKYKYSKDNGKTWEESSSNKFTFSGLTAGTSYKLKVQILNNKEVLDSYSLNKYVGEKAPILGVNTVIEGTGLYHHTPDLPNGAGDGSYRYAGSDPNNYICIGSNTNPCPDNNMYRIIGVFGGQLKVIKNTSIGGRTWNSKSNKNTADNNYNYWQWTEPDGTVKKADLNTYLNDAPDGFYQTLPEAIKNKIDINAKWYIEGHATTSITPKDMHDAEIKGNTITAPIGLMYAHDYGYTSSGGWDVDLHNYDLNLGTNWLGGLYEWTITRYSSTSYSAFNVVSSGYVNSDISVTNGSGVRPVYYLVSDTKISNGDGTLASPYQI